MNKNAITHPNYTKVEVNRYREKDWQQAEDFVLNEVPVALVYNGFPHVVIMCTPQDLEDFVYGFSLTEGIIRRAEDILSLELLSKERGIEVRVEIRPECFIRLESRKRQMSARTGCGICGLDSLEQVVRPQSPIQTVFKLQEEAVNQALREASSWQKLNQKTGGAHGAFWVSLAGEIQFCREDVGRHVAMDKLVGALIREGYSPSHGFILVTSRASFEMVQKAVAARVGLLVALSAPTYLAIELAKEMNLQLAAFSRIDKINLY